MEAAGQERDGWDGRNEETHKSASSKSASSACGQVLSSMWKVRLMIINFFIFFMKISLTEASTLLLFLWKIN